MKKLVLPLDTAHMILAHFIQYAAYINHAQFNLPYFKEKDFNEEHVVLDYHEKCDKYLEIYTGSGMKRWGHTFSNNKNRYTIQPIKSVANYFVEVDLTKSLTESTKWLGCVIATDYLKGEFQFNPFDIGFEPK